MFCEKCGNKMPDEAMFCDACGTKTVVQPAKSSAPAVPPVITQPVQRPVAAQPNPQMNVQQSIDLNVPLSIGQYIGMFFLMSIPILNIVLMFKWSFGSSVNQNKKNYARAVLILGVIGAGIGIAVSLTMGSAIMELNRGFY